MANEAVIIELFNGGEPMRFTVADGATIEKGTVLKMTDPRTAAASAGAGDIVAGIAAAEKVANDGSTTLAVYTNGIFDLNIVGGGSATLGSFVRTSGTGNKVTVMTTLDQETGKVVGRALETGSADETIAVRVLL